MDWRNEIASGLPSPRDDEPAGLRKAIEDELADHLACALERERGAEEDEAAARRAVLARFGNPRLVAYQLWWDAMKEKIMKDRLMIAASALLMLTCIVAIGALWLTLRESRAVNAALLEQIKELVARPAPAVAPAVAGDMAVVKLKTVKPDGKPMPGMKFELRGSPFANGKEEWLYIDVNDAGEADIGPIRAGQYYFQTRPGSHYVLGKSLLLYGGQTQELKMTCPDDIGSTPTAARLRVNLPPELAAALDPQTYSNKLKYYVGGCLVGEPRNPRLDGTDWQKEDVPFLIDAQGNITSSYGLSMDGPQRIATSYSINEPAEFKPTLPIARGRYRLHHMFVGLYSLTKSGSTWNQEQKVPAYLEFPEGKGPLFEIPDKAETTINMELPESLRKALSEAFIEETAVLQVKDWYHFRDSNFTPEFWSTTTEQPETLVKIKAVQGTPETKELNLKQGQSGNVNNIEVTVLEILHEGGIRCRCRFRFVPQALGAGSLNNQTNNTTQTQAPGGRP